MELRTFDLTYKKPLDGGAFVSALGGVFEEACWEVRECLRVWEGVGKRIIRERNLIVPDSATWGFVHWSGLTVYVNLEKTEGFDALHDYYELASHQAKHARGDGERKHEPDPEDYAEISRRSWKFQVGKARFTLCAMASYDSDICKRVEVGMEPKFKLVCRESAL